MKNFANELANLIIEDQRENIDKIMNEVTRKIMRDFATKTYELLDQYYNNYTPIRYVRVYGEKRKLRAGSEKKRSTSAKAKAGQVSLHAAITRRGENAPAIGVSGGSYDTGYIGGIVIDESQFKENGMRHIGKGKNFTEWNIVENFMFAGEGGYGDWRSYTPEGYSYPSADEELNLYMDSYGSKVDEYYKDALSRL